MTEEAPAQARGDGTLLRVQVQPRASRDGVDGVVSGRLRIRLTAPPVEGAANEALVRLLSGLLGVPRRQLTLTAGERGRKKSVLVAGVTPQQALQRLGVEGA